MPFPALLLLLGVVLILQTTIMDYLSVYGVKPDLVMLLVIFNGFLLGPKEGAFLGFAGGIIEDLFSGSYIGINALTKMVAGYLAGFCGERLYKENSLVVAGVAFFSTTVGLLINYFLLLYLKIYMPFFYTLFRVILPTALYTAVLAPFFYKRVLHLVIIKNKDL
ncbi:rod shape-determining protein MreD [Pelotomaculum isophthalicicum JI]|uniref:Rod shape-determining protein MreD n=1 Tax=Pelotomaculum isophthalicicum JI TaxID=947010 RepID=A0A9X4JT81_9FIRM|nr:rod shape-determining protein MreD [Pelotomaculum isophthalicicum]MDF9408304.1 rod shape-determining protein MreD [Pelotomaculum isophthalicicum JI]